MILMWFNLFINHFQASYTGKILTEAVILIGNLWPYLVFGILATTGIKMFLSKNQVITFFQHTNNFSIILAALFGLVSPLGSYVVIPLSGALYLLGIPLPVIIAFAVSSPLINPNLFLLTAGSFGYEMALLRLLAAFLLGTTSGYCILWLIKMNYITAENCVKEDNGFTMVSSQQTGNSFSVEQFSKELLHMTTYIGKFFLLSIGLAAFIKILAPPNLLIRVFNGNTYLSVLASTGAGIPFYVCGGAAIPVIQQLADLGMSKGAVLAFFISGPVLKLSNLILMHSVFNVRILVLYLITGTMGAFTLGLVYNFF